MIEKVIKRDGSVQAFDPNKINGWGEWASNNLKYVNWSEIVLGAMSKMDKIVTSEDLQNMLIEECLNKNTWNYQLMAGRLYSALKSKSVPKMSLKERHKMLGELGIMCKDFTSHFSDAEYDYYNSLIDYKLDQNIAYSQLYQFYTKYLLQNLKTGQVMEHPQDAIMRVAMGLCVNLSYEERMKHIPNIYKNVSLGKINIPTPFYVNIGTPNNGYLSCCVYNTKDTANSLAAGDHIGYMMTVNSAGIGVNIVTRSIDDPVRGGVIKHQGKLPYYKALASAVRANLQNGRGGASTISYTCFDPEIETLVMLRNANTPKDRAIRESDFSFLYNEFFARKASRKEESEQEYWTFSVANAPEVFEAFYSDDTKEFERVYNQAVEKGLGARKLNARDILITALSEGISSRLYNSNITEMNRHTPFKDPIYLSNLCQEIALPTRAYDCVTDLYKDTEASGEVGMCALSGINIARVDENEYEQVAFYALFVVDQAITLSSYSLPNIAYTANKRRSAGIGIVGLAEYLAKHNLSYTTQDGRNAIHEVCERHAYYLKKASVELSKMFGPCPWSEKLKDAWLPIDTYKKNVDELVTVGNKYDWEALRAEIKKYGVRNSTLVAHMPAESSAIASGTTNGLYPVRDIAFTKTNQGNTIRYVVPHSEDYVYDKLWDVSNIDLIYMYAIAQKWTCQQISSDLQVDLPGDTRKPSDELLKEFFTMVKYGVKSRYYVHNKTADNKKAKLEPVHTIVIDDGVCESCTI